MKTGLAGRIAEAVSAAGCGWPDAPCPCVDDCPVDLTGVFQPWVPAYGDRESADREADRIDWPDGQVPG